MILCPPYQKLPKYLKFLKQLFREKKYRIVHSNINTLSVFPLYAAKKAGVPVRIAHSHSTSNPREWKKNLMKNALRPFSKVWATDYFACSELAGRYLFGDKTFDKGEVKIIRNAIDVEKFKFDPEARKKLRKEIGIKDDDFVVGHIGRFVEQKNHRFLIDIFAEVKKEKKNAKLVLVGQGPLREEIEEKVKNLGLEKDVFFLGQRSDTNKLYSVFDVFCLPSLYEGLPVVGVEAQANGVPCVFSDKITKEILVSPYTQMLPIDSTKDWCLKIIEQKRNPKYKMKDFTIDNEQKNLTNHYIDKSKINITITNAYRWRNKGDAGILLGTIENLKTIFGKENIKINVLSFTPEEDAKHYKEDPCVNEVLSNLINPNPYKHTKIGKLAAVLKICGQFTKYDLGTLFFRGQITKKNKALTALNNSDVIVVCGGGFLGGKKFDSLMHVVQMNINTHYKKPTILLGTSVEPSQSKIVNCMTKRVLKKYDFIMAREIITYGILEKYIDNSKLGLCPDMAFMLLDPEAKKSNRSLLKIGVTVRKWNFPGSKNPEEKMDKYITELAKVLDYFIENKQAEVFFIPQVIVAHGNDAEVAKMVQSKMKKKNRAKFHISEEDMTPIEIKQFIGEMDVFLGTRMHSNIFATSMAIPTVAIAYEKKTIGIMHTVGLDDYVLDINNIDSKSIIARIDTALSESGDISKNLNEKRASIREEIVQKTKTAIEEIWK